MHIELAIQPSDSNSSAPTKAPTKVWAPRSKMFPFLVVLLMACYGIMAMVLIEQGSVIQSQRNLITQLASDSQHLLSLKGQEAAQQAIEKKRAEESKAARPSAKACKACKTTAPSNRNQRNMQDKQPLQTADRADWRRFPSKI